MKFLTSLAIATSLCAPAFAGGMSEPSPEPMVAPVIFAPVTANWTGFYVGAQLGYGDVSGDLPGTGTAPPPPTNLDGNGAIGGLHAGYRYDFGQFVTGVELAYNTANIDLGTVGELDSVTQLKLMGGYDLGQTLVYATAGAAHAKTTLGSDNGWLIGVGMDYAINDAWTLGGELTHHRFDDFDGTGADVRANLLQVKLGYRF
jgi:opacity protein-like surface antigen